MKIYHKILYFLLGEIFDFPYVQRLETLDEDLNKIKWLSLD